MALPLIGVEFGDLECSLSLGPDSLGLGGLEKLSMVITCLCSSLCTCEMTVRLNMHVFPSGGVERGHGLNTEALG